jgi:hypothetical protein
MRTPDEIRITLLTALDNLHLGDIELTNAMTIAELQSLLYDLVVAKHDGELDIETDQGIKNLKKIVDKYL